MKLTLPKPTTPWKEREHLFTPSNITKLEFANLKEKVCPPSCNVKMVVKALRHGPVKHLLGRGVFVLLTAEEQFFEDMLMEKGPQLSENRSGEPSEFWLGD
jgi:hypothetical protein